MLNVHSRGCYAEVASSACRWYISRESESVVRRGAASDGRWSTSLKPIASSTWATDVPCFVLSAVLVIVGKAAAASASAAWSPCAAAPTSHRACSPLLLCPTTSQLKVLCRAN